MPTYYFAPPPKTEPKKEKCPFKVGDRVVDEHDRISTIKAIYPPQFQHTIRATIIAYDVKSHGCLWEGIKGAALVDWLTLSPLASWIPYDYD